MRNTLPIIAILSLLAAPAAAQSQIGTKLDKSFASGKTLPLKGAASDNSCASYGPGFVRVAGTGTCVHVGGSVRVEGGGSAGRSR